MSRHRGGKQRGQYELSHAITLFMVIIYNTFNVIFYFSQNSLDYVIIYYF